MQPDRDLAALEDMLTYARFGTEAVRGRTPADLEADLLFTLGVQRIVEIIGEAARRLSPKIRQQYPNVPWADIMGMRHWLAHGYDVVDHAMLWDTVSVDLPALVPVLERIVADKRAQESLTEPGETAS